jgi:hypothetical protein
MEEYRVFLAKLFGQLNSGRCEKLAHEMEVLRPLPGWLFESARRVRVRVNSASLIAVERNSYSANSRLIGELVEARVFPEWIEVWYGGQRVEQLPRLRGRTNYRIDYRHNIDWLVRKMISMADFADCLRGQRHDARDPGRTDTFGQLQQCHRPQHDSHLLHAAAPAVSPIHGRNCDMNSCPFI